MKKLMVLVLAAMFLAVPVQTASAASEFSLSQGEITGDYLDNTLLKECLTSLSISAVYSEEQQKYRLSGAAEVKSAEYEMPDGAWAPFVGSDTGNGSITGEYDPLTGGFYGNLFYEAKFNGTKKGGELTCSVSYVQAEFTGISNPEDGRVALTFAGKDLTPNKDVNFTVTFSVQGTLPFTQFETAEPEESDEPEESEGFAEPESTENEPEDSNIRIKEIVTKSGNIYIRRAGTEKTEIADADTVIHVGDTIIVPKNGYGAILQLNSYKASEFFLRAGTELTIKEKQKAEVFGECFLKLGGKIADWFTDEEYNEDFGLETDRANTSIKGTIIVIKDDGETSSLKVIEGTAAFTSKASGESIMVEAGEMISATKDGLGVIESFNIDEELAKWENADKAEPEGFPLWAILAITGVVILTVLMIVVVNASQKKARTAYIYAANQIRRPMQAAFCSRCGAPLSAGIDYCANCGNKTSTWDN